jgi:uncharacterized membrane protein YkoI
MAQVRGELGGRVIKVKLKSKRGIHYYEFKVLAPSGRIWEISVNAVNGTIIEGE